MGFGRFLFLGSGPEGVDDLCLLEAQIPVLRSKSQPLGQSLTAKILSLRPKFRPRGIWAPRLGFGPQGQDMGFEAEI